MRPNYVAIFVVAILLLMGALVRSAEAKKIVAVGDSNTQGIVIIDNWCDMIPSCENYAVLGATASPGILPAQGLFTQLQAAWDEHPDMAIAILAGGAVDITYLLQDPSLLNLADPTVQGVAAWIVGLVNIMEELGVETYVASIPYRYDFLETPGNMLIDELNAELSLSFELINFTDGFPSEDYLDPVHIGQLGHNEMVQRVLQSPGGLADIDDDGVLNASDNCLYVANGPLAGVCSMQQDGDADGYGVACDTDFNGNSQADAVDLGLMFTAVSQVSEDVYFDLNCNGAADQADQGQVLADFLLGVMPGPSGRACAGFVPCP